VAAVLLGLLLTSGVARPVVRMAAAMRSLAAGDSTVEVPGRGRRDEVGAMAEAVQVFKDNAAERVRLEAEQAAEQAGKERRAAQVEALIRTFESGVTSSLTAVRGSVGELEETAQSMSSTAEETGRQATAVAAASEQASNNVTTVSTAAEELSSSIQEIGRQMSESTE